jgi:hypothetical protein
MRKWIAILAVLLMLGGCASKIPNTRMDKHGNYVPQTDYQAYALAKSHQEPTFDTFSLKGAEYIKIKGKNLELKLTDELKVQNNLEKPKSWFDRTMDSVDRAFPIVGSVAKWWIGLDFGKDVVDGLAKDPVIVEQRHDTVTSHDTVTTTETVEVVEQDVVVEVPTPFPQNIDNSTNTVNNYNSEPGVDEGGL